MEEQLKSLDNLKKEGFIQEAEYNRRKAELTGKDIVISASPCNLPSDFRLQAVTNTDGSFNNTTWKCVIPGLPNTPWEGGAYPLTIEFPQEYPTKPPKCKFPQSFLHPNVFPSGTVALPLLEKWNSNTSMQDVILGIQKFLNEPDLNSPAQQEGYSLAMLNKAEYEKRICLQAQKFSRSN